MRYLIRKGLTLSDFTRAFSGLLVATTVACAGTVTPPDATPVYADEIAPGVEPIDVEHQSTNRPDPEVVQDEKKPQQSSEGSTSASGEDKPSPVEAPKTDGKSEASENEAAEPSPAPN